MQPVSIEGDRLLLRPWRDDDLDAVWTATQDPLIALWSGPVAATREEGPADR